MLSKSYVIKASILAATLGIIAAMLVISAMWSDNPQGEMYNENGVEYIYIFQTFMLFFSLVSIPMFLFIIGMTILLTIIFTFLNEH